MASRSALKTLVTLGLAAGLGCSKTQDTAPESRIFGSPPIIQSVTVDARPGVAECDWTAFARVYLHDNFGFNADQYTFGGNGTFIVDAGYAETIVTARVVDPEDTPTKSDILLVTVSYNDQSPTPNEYSLLMFDDGKSNGFPYLQKYSRGGGFEANCVVDVANNIYHCDNLNDPALLNSNDQASGDHVFTRGFGFTYPGAGVYAGLDGISLLSDCVATANHQYPTVGTLLANKTLSLKIEAVDHEGNLTTWPLQPTSTIGPSSLHSPTDECTLCLMGSSDFGTDCHGKQGLIITDTSTGLPLGELCKNIF